MRILHVSDCFPPRLGGIETQVEGIVEQQKQRGHEAHVLTLTIGAKTAATTRLRPHIGGNLLIRLGSKNDIRSLYEDFKPDVIHAHVGSGAWLGWAAVKFAQQNSIPLVLTIHSMWGALANLVYRGRLSNSERAHYVTVSQQARQCIRSSSTFEVVANGLNVSDWKPGIAKASKLTFITASRLVSRKRIIELIEIFHRLHEKYPNQQFELRIAGDGPLKSTLQRMLKRSAARGVILLGRLSREQLHQEFSRAHAYIQLSKLEAFGLAAAEAQACGLCVIGLKESGISDFVQHNVDGFLGEHDAEIESFLEKVMQDPTIVETLGDNVDVKSKPYQWNLVLDHYDKVYRSVIGAP